MNRFALALSVGVTGIALLAGCGSEEADTAEETATATEAATEVATETATAEATATEAATETATAEATAEAATLELTLSEGAIQQDGAAVEAVEIPVGTTVVFTNSGAEAVTLTSGDGAIDAEIAPAGTLEFTFEAAGAWDLSLNGEPAGTVTVQ